MAEAILSLQRDI